MITSMINRLHRAYLQARVRWYEAEIDGIARQRGAVAHHPDPDGGRVGLVGGEKRERDQGYQGDDDRQAHGGQESRVYGRVSALRRLTRRFSRSTRSTGSWAA